MILIDASGTVQIKHRNNSNVIEVSDSAVNIISGSGGEINIASNATVNLNAPTVNMNATSVVLGENGSASGVKGEKLIGVLQQIVAELNTKFPQSASTLVGRDFKEILSDTVKLG